MARACGGRHPSVVLGFRCATAALSVVVIAVVVRYPIIGPPRRGQDVTTASVVKAGGGARSGAGQPSASSRSAALAGGGPSGSPASTTPAPAPSDPAAARSSTAAPAGAGGVPATTSTTSVDPVTPTGVIGARGGDLTLNGQIYRFTGVDAYEIATQWGTNAGCGADVSEAQLDQFFASLRPDSLVRFWAFQGTMATNVDTGQIDWAPLDRVFAAAAAYGQRLIPVLTDQGGTCDGDHWQDPSWYNGGFEQVFDDPSPTNGVNLTPLSYWNYLRAIVNRYKDSPALGMWEPISEAEASTCPPSYEPSNCSGNQTCPDEAAAAQALRSFFDVVGAEIHSLDPVHLVEDGLLGSGQCGTSGSDYQYVSASPGVDVLSYHDYYGAAEPVGGDQWNGLAVRFSQAAAVGKPIIGGEAGIIAGSGAGCESDTERATDVLNKVQSQMAAGSSGVLVWNWLPTLTQACSYDVAPGDPVLSVLSTVAL